MHLTNFAHVSPKAFILGAAFIQALRQALAKKNILLSEAKVNHSGALTLIIITVFFRYKKLKKYEKKHKKPKVKNLFLNLLAGELKYASVFSKITNLNKKTKLKLAVEFLILFKQFKNRLFARRFDLFADFVNLSALFARALLSVEAYLLLLKQIFSIILKKKHVHYFLFINLLIKKIALNNAIQGIKFSIAGRLKGKPRTNTLKMLSGKLYLKSTTKKTYFSKIHAFTRYGVFGLKLWITLNATI